MPQKTKLYRILEENFEEERLTPIARKYFNDTYGCPFFLLSTRIESSKPINRLIAGMNYIRQYGIEENRATLELLLVKKSVSIISCLHAPCIITLPLLLLLDIMLWLRHLQCSSKPPLIWVDRRLTIGLHLFVGTSSTLTKWCSRTTLSGSSSRASRGP